MEQMRTIVQASAVYRALAALCLWFGGQWTVSYTHLTLPTICSV